jgi:trehalose/maltose hydrolase-like predicted phosphorylase
MSVYPEYRKGGISRLVHCFMCKYQHEQGIELMVSTTMYDVPLQGLIRYGSYVVYEIEYYVRNNLFKEYIMMTNLKTAADICDCKLKELKAKL